MDKLSVSTRSEAFDPFGNRLCRDIRNQLSRKFIEALSSGDVQPIIKTAGYFLNQSLKPYMRDYIENRLKLYSTIFQQVESSQNPTQNMIAISLWNNELFFEFHELLEKNWMRSTGAEKKALQALILSAGSYMLLSNGRTNGAIKMASKAIEGLQEFKKMIPACFDAELLIAKLSTLDSPPKFTLLLPE